MNCPTAHIETVLTVFATLIVTAMTPLVFAATPNSDLLIFILPLLGALLMAGAAILLNPAPETRRIVIGRSIIAILFGVTTPQAIPFFHSNFDPLKTPPIILAFIGAISAFVPYMLSRPFFNQAYAKSEAVAKNLQDELVKRVSLGVISELKPDVARKNPDKTAP